MVRLRARCRQPPQAPPMATTPCASVARMLGIRPPNPHHASPLLGARNNLVPIDTLQRGAISLYQLRKSDPANSQKPWTGPATQTLAWRPRAL